MSGVKHIALAIQDWRSLTELDPSRSGYTFDPNYEIILGTKFSTNVYSRNETVRCDQKVTNKEKSSRECWSIKEKLKDMERKQFLKWQSQKHTKSLWGTSTKTIETTHWVPELAHSDVLWSGSCKRGTCVDNAWSLSSKKSGENPLKTALAKTRKLRELQSVVNSPHTKL